MKTFKQIREKTSDLIKKSHSKRGAPGTLKAKIDGKMTLAKARALKNKPGATTLDKKQANFYINMHSEADGCWPGYKAIGGKMKNGKMVPNCVPESTSTPQDPDIKDRKGSQPARYHAGMSVATKKARDARFKKTSRMADDNPAAYKDRPGDKAARKDRAERGNPPSDHTKYVRNLLKREDSFADKSKASGISVGTLKKVYRRGVAAFKTGARPGMTPQAWGHARVNAFIRKKKQGGLNHDKDLA